MITVLRLGPVGAEIPALRMGDEIYDLRSLTDDVDGTFLAGDGLARASDAARGGALPLLDGADDMRIGAPIARPQAVLCIGQNYAAHAAESGDAVPEVPILFFKHPATVVGPFDDIRLPAGAEKLDWEIELGVVIGRPAYRLSSPSDALAHIAGYVASHDVSERAWQIEQSGGQWSKGKSAPTFNPVGPFLVPAAEVVDPQALRLWSRVNGERRQDSTTADMVFSVAEIVHHLSQYCELQPGDLINTGTPQGVALSGRFPYLADGDVVELGIDGLGEMRQVVRATA
jgi:2,4-didehydro-3-deoxy-L-rhamnonate hydrolase